MNSQFCLKQSTCVLLTWVDGVRLETIHHMFICLQKHCQFPGVTVPYEDVSTIWPTHDIMLTPEVGFFDLKIYQTYSWKDMCAKVIVKYLGYV